MESSSPAAQWLRYPTAGIPRTPDGKLEAFAPHGLDEYAELQFAAARHLEGVGLGSGWGYLQCNIAFRFAQKALAKYKK